MITSYNFEQALRLTLKLDESAEVKDFKEKVSGVDYDYLTLQINGDAIYQVGFDHTFFAIKRVTEDDGVLEEIYVGTYEEFEAEFGYNPQQTPMKKTEPSFEVGQIIYCITNQNKYFPVKVVSKRDINNPSGKCERIETDLLEGDTNDNHIGHWEDYYEHFYTTDRKVGSSIFLTEGEAVDAVMMHSMEQLESDVASLKRSFKYLKELVAKSSNPEQTKKQIASIVSQLIIDL